MKKTILATVLLSAATTYAGGLPSFPTARQVIKCESPSVSAIQSEGQLTVQTPSESPLVQKLASRGILVKGYAHDAGFLTKGLEIGTQELLIDSQSLNRLDSNDHVVERTRISNSYDYSFAQLSPEPNGQKSRYELRLSGNQTDSLIVQVIRVHQELRECVRRESDGLFNHCIESIVIAAGSERIEEESALDLGTCILNEY